MEEDFLLVPASMLSYATRFLEHIPYDIARDNGHEVNINREIIIRKMENVSRNNLISSKLKYDFDHWMKWGLIDRKNTHLTVDEVKEILAQYV